MPWKVYKRSSILQSAKLEPLIILGSVIIGGVAIFVAWILY